MSTKDQLRHQSLRRLLAVAKEVRGMEGPAALAGALDESEQTVTNWGRRGVSRSGAMKAQAVFGCSANWVLHGTGVRFIGAQSGPEMYVVREPTAEYTHITPAQIVQGLAQLLAALDEGVADIAALYMEKLAHQPDGRWAKLLTDLLEKEAQANSVKVRTRVQPEHQSTAPMQNDKTKRKAGDGHGSALKEADVDIQGANDERDKAGGFSE